MAKKKRQSTKAKVAAKDAEYGENMIEIRLRFWTNNIAETDGQLLPKNAWCAGIARIEQNDAHGIKAGKPEQFHTLLDIGSTIEKILIDNGIVLHPSRKMSKYSPRPKKPKK